MAISAPITTYQTLKDALADYMNRDDLTAQLPVFIQLAESEMRRQVQRASSIVTVSLTQASNPLASAYTELRSIRLVTSDGSQDTPIYVVSAEHLAEVRAAHGNASGRPRYATIIAGAPGNSKLLVAPTPDTAYTAELITYDALVPLSAATPTNDVLSEAPDAYLYGSLLAAETFLEHDERVPVWRDGFDRAVAQLNAKRAREESSASLRPIRLPYQP